MCEVGGTERNKDKVGRLAASLARNESTLASDKTLMKDAKEAGMWKARRPLLRSTNTRMRSAGFASFGIFSLGLGRLPFGRPPAPDRSPKGIWPILPLPPLHGASVEALMRDPEMSAFFSSRWWHMAWHMTWHMAWHMA